MDENNYFFQEPSFIHKMITIVCEANEILRNERTPQMKIDEKIDSNGRKSKVTSGDIKSNTFIIAKLQEINEKLKRESIGFYNIVSEENAEVSFEERTHSHIDGTWFVDPLDGTADYCNFDLEVPCYTVNIGLVMKGDPVFGIFSVPETGVIYYGIKSIGSFKISNEKHLTYMNMDTNGNICNSDSPVRDNRASIIAQSTFPGKSLRVKKDKDFTQSGIRVATSASHMNEKTEAFINKWLASDVTHHSFASSLKLGAVADGTVDIYPRCGPTSEWDTCAADAVVRFAGGGVYIYDEETPPGEYREMLKYNKKCLLNPSFIVL